MGFMVVGERGGLGFGIQSLGFLKRESDAVTGLGLQGCKGFQASSRSTKGFRVSSGYEHYKRKKAVGFLSALFRACMWIL